MNGKKVRVTDLRGKIVVLNFWATWCVPCRAEMPLLVEAEKEYAPRGVVFVAVSLDDRETRPKIPDFIGEFKIGFPVWVGGEHDGPRGSEIRPGASGNRIPRP